MADLHDLEEKLELRRIERAAAVTVATRRCCKMSLLQHAAVATRRCCKMSLLQHAAVAIRRCCNRPLLQDVTVAPSRCCDTPLLQHAGVAPHGVWTRRGRQLLAESSAMAPLCTHMRGQTSGTGKGYLSRKLNARRSSCSSSSLSSLWKGVGLLRFVSHWRTLVSVAATHSILSVTCHHCSLSDRSTAR